MPELEERKRRCGCTEPNHITRNWDWDLGELRIGEGRNSEPFDADHTAGNRVVTVADREGWIQREVD